MLLGLSYGSSKGFIKSFRNYGALCKKTFFLYIFRAKNDHKKVNTKSPLLARASQNFEKNMIFWEQVIGFVGSVKVK